MKMEKQFGDVEIEKQKFHQHKKPVSINNIDTNKVKVSDKVFFLVKKILNSLLVTKILKK